MRTWSIICAMTSTGRIAGIDGCRAGWFVVAADNTLRDMTWFVAETVDRAAKMLDDCEVIGIDIPIGVPDAGPRQCDFMARKLLSPGRTSSVFPAPIRPVLGIRDYRQACDLRESIDGSRMSKQAFNILPKIDEVDRYVRATATPGARLYEVHPELAFTNLNRSLPMQHPKRTAHGFSERLAHLSKVFSSEPLNSALSAFPRAKVAKDDVLDAFAVLAAAQRIVDGRGQRVPLQPDYDAKGINMAIWF